MSNEVRIPITVTGEDQADRDLKKVEKAVERVGDALGDMGGQAESAGKASEKAGGRFREAADDTGHLNRQIQEATENLRRLAVEFDRTGDAALEKQIGQQQRRLGKLNRIAGALPEPGEASPGMLKKVAGGIGELAAAAPLPAKAAGGVLGAMALPFLGGAVSAAVLGGVGAGGLIGGLSLASDDPQVQASAQRFAAAVGSAFSANGETFAGPASDALDKLATTGVQAAEKLRPGMDALAATVGPLADGIDGLVDNALPGLSDGLKAAAPLLRLAANELPDLGRAIGDAVGDIAEDPDGAILALKAIFEMTKDVIGGVGEVVSALSQAYEWSVRTGAQITGDMEDVFGWVPFVGGELARVNDDLEGALAALDKVKTTNDGLATSTEKVTYHTHALGVAADDATDALNAQREATSKLVDLELAAVGGTIAFERAIDSLAEARKENGKSLDLDTEKGRSNTEAILAGIEAVKENAQREYDLAIAHGATAQEAEKAAQTYRDTFGKELRAQIIRLFGNTQAVRDLLAELDKLNGKRVTFTVIQKGGRTVGHQVSGGIQLAGDEGVYRRASGGPVRPGPAYWVGENGPELVEFGANGTVHSAARSQAMVARGGGGQGGYSGPVRALVSVDPTAPSDWQAIARLLIPALQVVIAGMGTVDDALGRPNQ